MEDFINDPVNRSKAHILANQILTASGGSWFTVELLLKKFQGITADEVKERLAVLQMFDLCVCKEYGTGYKYKITPTKETKITFNRQLIASYEAKIMMLKRDNERLESEK